VIDEVEADVDGREAAILEMDVRGGGAGAADLEGGAAHPRTFVDRWGLLQQACPREHEHAGHQAGEDRL
jgi:hypothetical protein